MAVVLALFFAVLLSDGVSAGDVPPAGKVVNVRGGVQVIGMTTTTAVPGLLLRNGDTIVTGAVGWVAVVLADETLLQLNRNSRFTIKEVAVNAGWNRIRNVAAKAALDVSKSLYSLTAGEGWFRNKNRNVLIDIESVTLAVGVRGTEFNLKIGAEGESTLTALEGRVNVVNELGSLDVRAGEQAVARPGRPRDMPSRMPSIRIVPLRRLKRRCAVMEKMSSPLSISPGCNSAWI